MTPGHARGKASLLSALILLVISGTSSAQHSKFRFEPERIDVGTLYTYEKSNIDGSHAGRIALYVAGRDRLESFKWHEGGGAATLVTADMDWKTFSVRRFESWRVQPGGERHLQARLEKIQGEPRVRITFGESSQTATIKNWPWHSYDFDFGSLNFSFRHLVDPESTFVIGISDFALADESGTRKFADKGTVTVKYLGRQDRSGVDCRKYAIDGKGLENRGGVIWVHKEKLHIVDYEIDLPDERGFDSGKLLLVGVEQMGQREWREFMRRKMDAGKKSATIDKPQP